MPTNTAPAGNYHVPYVTRFDNRQENRTEPKLVAGLLDCSGSMAHLLKDLAKGANQDILGALYGINKADRHVIRVHLDAFGDEVVPLWRGFRALWDNLGEAPVSVSQLSGPGLGGQTALNKCILKSFGHLVQAGDTIAEQLNMWAQGKFIVLTDGFNNLAPMGDEGTTAVKKTFTHKQKMVKTHRVLAYFKTEGGLDRDDFRQMAIACGFNEVFFFDQHATNSTALQKALRRALQILSDDGLAKNSVEREVLEW